MRLCRLPGACMFTLLLIAGSVEAGDNAQEGRIPPTDLEDQNVGTAQPLIPDFGFLTGQPRLLALREVGTMATDRNPRIDMTRAGIDEAQAGRFIATSSLLPTVAPFSRLGRTDGRIQGSFGNLRNVDFNSVQVGAVLRYELNPAATAFRMKSAGHRLDAAEAYDSETTINVFAQATHQYLDLQYAAARLAITRELVHNARDLVDFSKAREYRGIGLGEDVYRADAELAAAERRLRDAQRQYIAVMLALSETLYLEDRAPLVPRPAFPEALALADRTMGVEALVERARQTHPSVITAREAAAAAASNIAVQKWEYLSPRIGVEYQLGGISDRYSDLGRRQGVTGYVSWNLTAMLLGERKRHTARRDIRDADVRRVERAVERRVRTAYEDVQTYEELITLSNRQIEAAAITLQINQARFSNGMGLTLEVIDAQDALAEARIGYYGVLTAFNKAQITVLQETAALNPHVFESASSLLLQ